MTEEQKTAIIRSGKDCFRDSVITNHIKNLENLHLKDFKINPFTVNYLAALLCGNTEPESLAAALLYPRTLGTSISTSFGQNIQIFISRIAEASGSASAVEGIDIEFIDALDGRKKYCQCKSGLQTINKDDVETIIGHFDGIKRKARLDRLPLQFGDLIVGVLYGTESDLSAHYKRIQKEFPVYCGADFWERLTGDKDFYHRLTKAFGEVVEEENINGSELIERKIQELAEEIRAKGGL